MSQTKGFLLLAGAALGLSGASAATAQSTNPDEVRALVAEMLADAQGRTSLLADTAGRSDKGSFFISSADGSTTLNIGGQIQFRYVMNFRDDENIDDFDPGFQTRRTKIWMHGKINNDWFYRVQGAFDRDGGVFGLEEAYAGYDFGNNFKVRWGQFKLPFGREELVRSEYQLAAEGSVTNEIFNQDYSQGIEVSYEHENFRVMGAFSDGFGSRNTDFTSMAEADFAFTSRFEYKFQGAWEDFEDFTAKPGQNFSALVGAALHYQQSANTNAPTDVDEQYLAYTADVSLEGNGWNAFAAFHGRHVDTRGPVGSTGNPEFDDLGLVIQGGYRFQDTELFARWDAIFLDDDRVATGDEDFHFLTVGVNQYFAGHAAKGTVDLVYAFNETPNLAAFGPPDRFSNGGFPNTGVGLLGDMDEGEIVIRLQFQLLF